MPRNVFKFLFYIYSKEDVESLLDIIKREILYVSEKKKNI